MALDRLNTTKFFSDKDQAQRSAREQLKFIMANLKYLTNQLKNSALSLNNYKENFTSKQLSFIDSIYEKVMKGAGYESFQVTYKPKKNYGL